MTDEPQHLKALASANRIRFERAQVKRDLKSGKITIPELLQDIPEGIESATVYEMLDAMDRWGRVRSRRLLTRLGISEWVTFRNLTGRQKLLLMSDEELS